MRGKVAVYAALSCKHGSFAVLLGAKVWPQLVVAVKVLIAVIGLGKKR